MADKQYYMSPDGTVIEQKDYAYLKSKKANTKGYEKSFTIKESNDDRTNTRKTRR
jgi:hypothetical protein